jgi:hypothetical protein
MAEVNEAPKMATEVAKKYRFKGKHSAMRYILPSGKQINLSTASVAEVDLAMKNGWDVLEEIPATAAVPASTSDGEGSGKKK